VNVALFTWRPGESSGVALLLPAAALTTVLAIASFDAAWRRSRLPRPAIAVAVASVALVVLEYTA
jgi:hypothetical protein